MPYVVQEWNNDDPETPLSASRLTYIEEGIEAATDAAEDNVAISRVTGLQSALDGKQESGSYAAASHTHDISDVNGLQAIIDDLTDRIEALEPEE